MMHDGWDGWHWGFGHWGIGLLFWVVVIAALVILLKAVLKK